MVGENSGEWRVAGEQWPVNAKKSQHLFTAHTGRVPVSVPFTLCHRASGPFRAPFALPSQWIQGREVEMTVQCQNRANCVGVYRCQVRTYDEEMRGSNGAIDG